jgi:hypothetical protein
VRGLFFITVSVSKWGRIIYPNRNQLFVMLLFLQLFVLLYFLIVDIGDAQPSFDGQVANKVHDLPHFFVG